MPPKKAAPYLKRFTHAYIGTYLGGAASYLVYDPGCVYSLLVASIFGAPIGSVIVVALGEIFIVKECRRQAIVITALAILVPSICVGAIGLFLLRVTGILGFVIAPMIIAASVAAMMQVGVSQAKSRIK